ncbi:MAG: hypothetical protein OYH77_01815, partial [Pseudomonadota bacterium]|nr:hypothetical protein [Pseudomonadota bacterium]
MVGLRPFVSDKGTILQCPALLEQVKIIRYQKIIERRHLQSSIKRCRLVAIAYRVYDITLPSTPLGEFSFYYAEGFAPSTQTNKKNPYPPQ